MAAAVSDHFGGRGPSRNRAISKGGESASGWAALHASAIGMQKEAAVAAAHHREPEPDDPAGLIAQLVRNPVAFGDGFRVEQDSGDLGISRAFKPAIERAQRKDEPVAPLGCEDADVGTWCSAGEPSPQTERGCGTNVEDLVERDEDGNGVSDLIFAVKAQPRAAQLDDLISVVDGKNGLEAARWNSEFRIGEAVRDFGQGYYRREDPRRPENGIATRGM